MPHLITRRSFLGSSARATVAAGLASMVNIPLFLQQALAEGTIGISGKKLLFIFLRGGNDGINNIIPIMDPAYGTARAAIGLPKDPAVFYDAASPACDVVASNYPYGIKLGNGFAALHPALYDLAPVYNAGDLALVHRVAYRSQSRSHFDSEKYWEKGADGSSANRSISNGVFYRTIVESGWNLNHALSGVSIQSNMPQSLRGELPMTNLSSISRYNLLGVSNPSGSVNSDRLKHLNAIDAAILRPRPNKDNRDLVYGLGTQFRDTLDIFQDPTFATNEFYDANGTTHLFPIGASSDQKGLGSGAYGFFQNIKSAAQVLANTDAVIAGTEMGGFDTHTAQVTVGSPHLGGHANLLRRLGWAYNALRQFFSNPAYNVQGRNIWNDLVVVTMSEFGRTSKENGSIGTDHAEASVMYVAGGAVNHGVYACDASINATMNVPNWTPGDAVAFGGSMFAANTSVGYLKRAVDYRSVLGEIIRNHLGATQNQLNRIIPGYAIESTEHLKNGTSSGSTPIIGELGIV